MRANCFVSVELEATAKSPGRSPTKENTPLEFSNVNPLGHPLSEKPLTATNTEDNDGIAREVADDLNISSSPTGIVIDDSAIFDETERGEELIEGSGTTLAIIGELKGSIQLPDLSSMMVTDILGTSNFVIDSTATTETSWTTSPKFTCFLPRDIDKSEPKSPPPMIACEIPLRLNIASGTTAPQTSDMEVNMDPIEPPKSIVVTCQEILTLTSVFARIPNFPNEALGTSDWLKLRIHRNHQRGGYKPAYQRLILIKSWEMPDCNLVKKTSPRRKATKPELRLKIQHAEKALSVKTR